MNILLVQPQFKKTERSYPLGLGYISSFLKNNGYKVFGADLAFSSIDGIENTLIKKKIDLIGVSAMSYNASNALNFIQYIRSKTSIPIVLGGPHATIQKENLFRATHNSPDYAIIGEGESAMFELVTALENKGDVLQIQGLIWKQGKEIFANKERDLAGNLDSLPFPDREIFPIFNYNGMLSRHKYYTQIVTSRGCPHNCTYCPEERLWRYWRKRSPENIANEMQSVIERFGIKEFHIEDSNFFGGDIGRIRDLCFEIIRRGLRISWQCTNGIPLSELEDLSIIDLMAEAGCYSIALGVESFNNTTVAAVKRRQDRKIIPAIIERCKRNKMEITCYLVLGFPNQKLKDIKADISYSRKLNFDFIQYSVFRLIPGSDAYEKFCTDRKINKRLKCHILVDGVNEIFIKLIQRIAYLSLCFKMSVLLFIFKRLKYTKEPFIFVKKFYDYVFGQHTEY
jgi:radical SAM superfamily enzyme YgiQ (UPF0313 family)